MGGLRAARDGFAVVEHVFHCYRQGGVVTQHHHSQRVADEDGVYARAVNGERARVIVGGEHRDWLAALLFGAEGMNRDFFAISYGGGGHGYLLLSLSKTPHTGEIKLDVVAVSVSDDPSGI